MEQVGEDKKYQVGKVSGIVLVLVLAFLQLSDWADRIAALSIIFLLIMTRYYRADCATVTDPVLAEK